jgi:hypothetical protein
LDPAQFTKLFKMKANVQYNDFLGTAAADISDHTDLEKFLKRRGVDTKRYEAIGAGFYHGYNNFFDGQIICVDNAKSTDEKKHLVSISFEADFPHEEFFDLFKRFSVKVAKRYHGFENMEIAEDITIDDREGAEDRDNDNEE